VCGQRWRRWQWRPPPAKGENSTGCRIDCSAAAMRAGNVVVPERHCRRRLTRGSRSGPPAAYTYYISHAAALVLVLVAPYPPAEFLFENPFTSLRPTPQAAQLVLTHI